MIRAFVTLCLISNPSVCKAPIEVTPYDHVITSPAECAKGGFIFFTQPRIVQQTPEEASASPDWFPKVTCRMEGDGSDIVPNWIATEKARLRALEPQIK